MTSNTEECSRLLGFICSGGASNIGTPDAVWAFVNARSGKDEVRKNAHLLLLMLEKITMLLKDDDLLHDVRQFYYTYGEYGYISYWLDVLKKEKVYYSDDKDGRRIIHNCSNLNIDINSGIHGMSSVFGKIESVDLVTFKNNMQNNPILQECGIFADKPIKCNNLKGYFIYELFDGCIVPLGYKGILNLM